MPIIKKCNGQIDRIMGDGIIVVFSKVFPNIKSDVDASNKSFCCCKEIIEELYKTEYEAKTAIGNGKLYFCKTGVEQIYEEYTAIGHPMTIVYRLENIAENNQILLMRNTRLSKRIEGAENYLYQWDQLEKEVFLKGFNLSRIHILQYTI
jgi:class 3 adenylate cyclase